MVGRCPIARYCLNLGHDDDDGGNENSAQIVSSVFKSFFTRSCTSMVNGHVYINLAAWSIGQSFQDDLDFLNSGTFEEAVIISVLFLEREITF